MTSLAEKYSIIANSLNTELMEYCKAEIEKQIKAAAERGIRNVHVSATPSLEKAKINVIKWLESEGFTVNWTYDRRDGNFIHIVY